MNLMLQKMKSSSAEVTGLGKPCRYRVSTHCGTCLTPEHSGRQRQNGVCEPEVSVVHIVNSGLCNETISSKQNKTKVPHRHVGCLTPAIKVPATMNCALKHY